MWWGSCLPCSKSDQSVNLLDSAPKAKSNSILWRITWNVFFLFQEVLIEAHFVIVGLSIFSPQELHWTLLRRKRVRKAKYLKGSGTFHLVSFEILTSQKIMWQNIRTSKKCIWYCTYKVLCTQEIFIWSLSKFSLHKRLYRRISEQERYLVLHLQFKTRDLASGCFCVISTWNLVLSQMSMF